MKNNNGGKDINIKAWGNPEEGKVVIYINMAAYDAIFRHGASYPEREVGGLLVGTVSSHKSGQHLVKIVGIVEAETAPGSQTEMQFVGEVWQQLVASAQRKFPDHKVVGWYHTHPGFGAFLSSDDINSHRIAFSHPWHVAAVCDPVKNELCFFGWDGQEIKAVKGFYIFEAPAEELTVLSPRKTSAVPRSRTYSLLIPAIAIVLLVFIGVVAFILFSRQPYIKPAFFNFSLPAQTASLSNQNHLYLYFFQNDGKVHYITLEWDQSKQTATLENPELEYLPGSPGTNLKEVQSPSITPVNNRSDKIGELSITIITENNEIRQLKADILSNGKLEWQSQSLGAKTQPELNADRQ
jgi:proteasome lid subunit RPN8/RPN11